MMDRLTKMNKFPNGDKEYVVDTKLASNREAIQRLAYFEDLEEQGLLIKLPCRVGDKIWWLNGKIVMESEVISFRVDEDGVSYIHTKYLHNKEKDRWYGCNLDFLNFGKTVFLTREEAELKLKEIK